MFTWFSSQTNTINDHVCGNSFVLLIDLKCSYTSLFLKADFMFFDVVKCYHSVNKCVKLSLVEWDFKLNVLMLRSHCLL